MAEKNVWVLADNLAAIRSAEFKENSATLELYDQCARNSVLPKTTTDTKKTDTGKEATEKQTVQTLLANARQEMNKLDMLIRKKTEESKKDHEKYLADVKRSLSDTIKAIDNILNTNRSENIIKDKVLIEKLENLKKEITTKIKYSNPGDIEKIKGLSETLNSIRDKEVTFSRQRVASLKTDNAQLKKTYDNKVKEFEQAIKEQNNEKTQKLNEEIHKLEKALFQEQELKALGEKITQGIAPKDLASTIKALATIEKDLITAMNIMGQANEQLTEKLELIKKLTQGLRPLVDLDMTIKTNELLYKRGMTSIAGIISDQNATRRSLNEKAVIEEVKSGNFKNISLLSKSIINSDPQLKALSRVSEELKNVKTTGNAKALIHAIKQAQLLMPSSDLESMIEEILNLIDMSKEDLEELAKFSKTAEKKLAKINEKEEQKTNISHMASKISATA